MRLAQLMVAESPKIRGPVSKPVKTGGCLASIVSSEDVFSPKGMILQRKEGEHVARGSLKRPWVSVPDARKQEERQTWSQQAETALLEPRGALAFPLDEG